MFIICNIRATSLFYIYTGHKISLCGQNAEHRKLNPVVYTVTTTLYRVY